MSRTWIFAGVFALICLGTVLYAGQQQEPPKTEEPFSGKLIVISSKNKGEHGAVLEKVKLRHLAGKTFLVGKSVDMEQAENWTKGQTVWFPMDEVGTIVEFNSAKELKEAYEQARLGNGL